MGSNDHIEVPDPQPKPISELLADIMERNAKALRFDSAVAVKQLEEDVPRLVKTMEYLDRCYMAHEKSELNEVVRILAGQEEAPDA